MLRFFIVLNLCVVTTLANTAGYRLEESWPDISVTELPYYGSGLVINGDGNLVVLHRAQSQLPEAPFNVTIDVDVVLVVDGTTGRALRSWGANMFIHPHGIEMTENGDIFITDSRYHQVLKYEFNSTTQLWNEMPILTLGERFVSGSDSTHFCTPADVVVMPVTGDFYVADGYCNSRIVKFDRLGNYLLEFGAGSANSPNPPVPFDITHGVTLALRRPQSARSYRNGQRTVRNGVDDFLVLVADRDNSRIQCFNSTGAFMYEITHEHLGAPSAMLFSVAYADMNELNPVYHNDYGIVHGVNGNLPWGQPRVFQIALGDSGATIVSSFQTSPNVTNVGNEAPHDIAVSRDGRVIYVVIATSQNLILRKFQYFEDDDNSAGTSAMFFQRFELLVIAVVWTVVHTSKKFA